MRIIITIQSSPAEPSTHLRRLFYLFIKSLGFKNHKMLGKSSVTTQDEWEVLYLEEEAPTEQRVDRIIHELKFL